MPSLPELLTAGRLDEARTLGLKLTHERSEDPASWLGLSAVERLAGNFALAREHARKAESLGARAAALHELGACAAGEGDLEGARGLFVEAARLDRRYLAALNHLGNALCDQGLGEEGIACYRAALEIDPAAAESWNNLGIAQAQSGRAPEAIESWRAALKHKPDHVSAWNNLGLALAGQREYGEAVECYRRALLLKPDYAKAAYNLGLALSAGNHYGEAASAFERALGLNPQWLDAALQAAAHHAASGASVKAEALARRALALDPARAEAAGLLARSLEGQRRYEEALGVYEQALARHPDQAGLHRSCAELLQKGGRLDQAIARFERAVELDANDAGAWNGLGVACYGAGDLARGREALARAVELSPGDAARHGNRLFALNYHGDISPAQLYAEHQSWGERHGNVSDPLPPLRAARSRGRPPESDRDPERPLRIGYVSPDFCGHSVASFIEPVLTHHDRERFEVHCYAELPDGAADDTTARLRAAVPHWVESWRLGDRELAERIRADGIDILVDLAGHTAHNRLPVFAFRPAPVQLSWIGYCNTTGLAAMDYRLTDAVADPPGQEAFHTEELVRLPRGFLCYAPPHEAPAVSALPAARAGGITFGSFNVLPKTGPGTVALWARVLAAVPNSRLLLKSRNWAGGERTRERYRQMFESHGIARARVELTGFLPGRADHLALYGAIDIALDPFPYNGTTTTCEALWMGVPVIALAGERHAARVSASLLTQAGLTEFVAPDPAGYIAKAAALAGDLARLAALRASLREQMRASALCDAAGFTREVEANYRRLWGQYRDRP